MAKEELDNEHTLTKETKKAIEDIIYQKKSIARDQEALKEAIEAVAEKLGVKKGVLTRRVNLIIKEEEKGGELKSQSTDLEFVEKYFNIE
jgi:glutamyl/glutaminyl-tRNA synthetase